MSVHTDLTLPPSNLYIFNPNLTKHFLFLLFEIFSSISKSELNEKIVEKSVSLMFAKLYTKTQLISSFQVQGATILIHGYIIKKIK